MLFANDVDKIKTNKKHTLQVLQDKKSFVCGVPQRASQSPPAKGSITVEAAFIIPLFIFALCGILSLCQILITKETIHQGLAETARELSKSAYHVLEQGAKEEDTKNGENITSQEGKKDTIFTGVISGVTAKELFLKYTKMQDFSYVKGGSAGIILSQADVLDEQEDINLTARYIMHITIPLFSGISYPVKESVILKAMTGAVYEDSNQKGEELFWVTQHGNVYHTASQCAYLELCPLEITDPEKIHRMKPCKRCRKKGKTGKYYATEYGDVIHTTLDCASLKRSVHSVTKEEIGGLPLCKKCAKKRNGEK